MKPHQQEIFHRILPPSPLTVIISTSSYRIELEANIQQNLILTRLIVCNVAFIHSLTPNCICDGTRFPRKWKSSIFQFKFFILKRERSRCCLRTNSRVLSAESCCEATKSQTRRTWNAQSHHVSAKKRDTIVMASSNTELNSHRSLETENIHIHRVGWRGACWFRPGTGCLVC